MVESTTNLATTNTWVAVTNPPVSIGDQRVLTNSIADGQRYYRLRKPGFVCWTAPRRMTKEDGIPCKRFAVLPAYTRQALMNNQPWRLHRLHQGESLWRCGSGDCPLESWNMTNNMTRTIVSFATRLVGRSLAALILTLTLAAAQSPQLRIYQIDVEQADAGKGQWSTHPGTCSGVTGAGSSLTREPGGNIASLGTGLNQQSCFAGPRRQTGWPMAK